MSALAVPTRAAHALTALRAATPLLLPPQAFAFSGSLLTIAAIVNGFVWYKKSSLAFPFSSVLLLLGLWLLVCAPLVAVGSFYGFKGEEIKHPVRINNIPRQIPPQPWYMHPALSALVGGILPFGSVFIELYFIMSSLWLAQIYLVFGFLAMVLLILVVTCAEISIVMVRRRRRERSADAACGRMRRAGSTPYPAPLSPPRAPSPRRRTSSSARRTTTGGGAPS